MSIILLLMSQYLLINMIPPNYEAPFYLKETRVNMYVSLVNNEVKLTRQRLTRWVAKTKRGDVDTPVHAIIYKYNDNNSLDYFLSNKNNKITVSKCTDRYKFGRWKFFDSTSGIEQKNLLILFDSHNDNKPLYAAVDSKNSLILCSSKDLRNLFIKAANIIQIYSHK